MCLDSVVGGLHAVGTMMPGYPIIGVDTAQPLSAVKEVGEWVRNEPRTGR